MAAARRAALNWADNAGNGINDYPPGYDSGARALIRQLHNATDGDTKCEDGDCLVEDEHCITTCRRMGPADGECTRICVTATTSDESDSDSDGSETDTDGDDDDDDDNNNNGREHPDANGDQGDAQNDDFSRCYARQDCTAYDHCSRCHAHHIARVCPPPHELDAHFEAIGSMAPSAAVPQRAVWLTPGEANFKAQMAAAARNALVSSAVVPEKQEAARTYHVRALVAYAAWISMALNGAAAATTACDVVPPNHGPQVNFCVARYINAVLLDVAPQGAMGADIEIIAAIVGIERQGLKPSPENATEMNRCLCARFASSRATDAHRARIDIAELQDAVAKWASRGSSCDYVDGVASASAAPLSVQLSDAGFAQRLACVDPPMLARVCRLLGITGASAYRAVWHQALIESRCGCALGDGSAAATSAHVTYASVYRPPYRVYASHLALGVPLAPPVYHDLADKAERLCAGCPLARDLVNQPSYVVLVRDLPIPSVQPSKTVVGTAAGAPIIVPVAGRPAASTPCATARARRLLFTGTA